MSPLIILLLLCSGLSAQPIFKTEPLVRVRIINTLDSLSLQLFGEYTLHSPEKDSLIFSRDQDLQIVKQSGQILLTDSSGWSIPVSSPLTLSSHDELSTILIQDVPFGVGWWWAGKEDRVYPGDLQVYLDGEEQLNVIVMLPLETYLKGVVPYEIGPTSPLEALKAQAVAARSEAIIALTSKLYSGIHHDLTSDVECQVFSGNKRRTDLSDQAVDETRGLILSESGKPINAYYASNCGGRAELIENVWPSRSQPESYLHSNADNGWQVGPKMTRNWLARYWIKRSPRVYCNPRFNDVLPEWSQKNFRWVRAFKTDELTSMLTDDPALGLFKGIMPLKRGVSGRIIKASVNFENGSFQVEGELALRQLFNPSLRSSNFYVKQRDGLVIFTGAGWGHGVGMCQSGAIAQAAKGCLFDEILQHYYSKADLVNIYPGQ